jgi:hypothetical protein
MASALLLIVTFHAVLWAGLAVLTALEPPHPERPPQQMTPLLTLMADDSPAEPDDEPRRAAA